jgi:2-iminoacetate synthase ThiH
VNEFVAQSHKSSLADMASPTASAVQANPNDLVAQSHNRSGGSVRDILEKALDGERLSDGEALALLESRELVAVGRAANEIRNRRADPDRITFIIDRNLNYTNICHTDCDFCAFYRCAVDTREGYQLP